MNIPVYNTDFKLKIISNKYLKRHKIKMKNVLFITQNDFSVCDVFLFSVNIKLRRRKKKVLFPTFGPKIPKIKCKFTS